MSLTSFSTCLNATTSPLLLLPAEIRNMIFEYAVCHGVINLNKRIHGVKRTVALVTCQTEPLLLVCRQIYSEVAILPYKLNIFSFKLFDFPYFSNFLEQRTQEQLDLMTEVRCPGTSFWAGVHVASAAIWRECFQKRESWVARNVFSSRRLARLISSLQQADTTVS